MLICVFHPFLCCDIRKEISNPLGYQRYDNCLLKQRQQTETKIPLFSHHSLFSREKETNDTNGSANH